MNESQIKLELDIAAKLALFDVHRSNCERYLRSMFLEDAQNSLEEAYSKLEGLLLNDPEVKIRSAIATALYGLISMAEGKVDAAKNIFKEAKKLLSPYATGSPSSYVDDLLARIDFIEEHVDCATVVELSDDEDEGGSALAASSNANSSKAGGSNSKAGSSKAGESSKQVKSKRSNEALSPTGSSAKKLKGSGPKLPEKKPNAIEIPDKLLPGVKSTNTEPGALKCPHCEKSFPYPSKLNRHIMGVHEKKMVRCPECDAELAVDSLKVHMDTIHKKIKKICPICAKEYVTQRDLNSHILTVHEGKEAVRFQCKVCLNDFARHRYMRNHVINVHVGLRRYKCLDCGSLFTQSSSLNSHLEGVHQKIAKYSCEKCERKFIHRKTFTKHTKTRKCFLCGSKFSCSDEYSRHRNSHELICDCCGKEFSKYGRAHAHANQSHIRIAECPLKCGSEFYNVHLIPSHMVAVHHMIKCHACPKVFDSETLMIEHCRKNHVEQSCGLCESNAFKFFTFKQLNTHIASSHQDIFNCIKCGIVFKTHELLQKHQCSSRFAAVDLKMLAFLKQPFDSSSLSFTASIFADEEGRISTQIPLFPPQATMFLNDSLNFNVTDQKIEIFINQDQRLFQIGSAGISSWIGEFNVLGWNLEMFEWQRSKEGAPLQIPKFDRKGKHFRRDYQDKIYDIRSSTLEPPFHLGHVLPAGNCWSLQDFIASFSNLNYFPMNERLNCGSWRLLEDHIRRESKLFMRAYILTGGMFMRNGKIVAEYVCGVYIPPAFFKIVAFEKFDGIFELKCWMMRNDDSEQSIDGSEVSLLLIERATKTKYLTKTLIEKIDKKCIERYRISLRRRDTFLGI